MNDVEHRYINFKGVTIRLSRNPEDGLWRSRDETVWAFADDKFSVDKKSRPGVGFFSWRSWWPWAKELTRAASFHDYMYSSPAYQAFNTREDADKALAEYIKSLLPKPANSVFAVTFKALSRIFGRSFWENKTTR